MSHVLALALLAAPAQERDGFLELDYAVELAVTDPTSELVHASAELSGLTGPLELAFPERSSYVTLEPRLVAAPDAFDGTGAPLALERLGPFRWRLDPGAAPSCRLAWSVELDHRRHPDVVGRDEYEQPYLREDHGLLTCATSILVPAVERVEDRLDATVRLRVPDGWAVEAPWPEVEPGLWRPPSPEALADDLIAIGAWQSHRESVGGVDLSVLFAPGQERLAESIAEPLARIVEAELELFGVRPHERYLFLFVDPAEGLGYGGSTKPNSMTLFLSPDLPLAFAEDGLRHLLAHEYHHTWMLSTCAPADELRFVMEGFTDWFAAVVPWRLGELADAAFEAKVLEQFAKADAALAELEGPLAAAGGDAFFEGGAAYRACYAAGFGIAAWTDLALRAGEAGFGLDELLRRFYNDPRWEADVQPTGDDWFELLASAAGEEVASLQRAAVEADDAIDWVSLFEAIGVPLERTVEPLGPSARVNYDGTVVTAIDPEGAGARLGLREGDRIVEIGGRPVVDERTARQNWREGEDGWIRVAVERDGERVLLEAPYPTRAVYRWGEGAPAPLFR